MGYTHYYRMRRDMTEDEFKRFGQDVERLIAALPNNCGAFNTRYALPAEGNPSDQRPLMIVAEVTKSGFIVDKNEVGFNGAGFEDAGHESFWVERSMKGAAEWEMNSTKTERFMFTKTAHKPYDVLVCAVLLVLKDVAPDAWVVTSDGEVPQWAPSARFASQVLDRPMPLSDIGIFRENLEELIKAQVPTPWMEAEKLARFEATELAKAASPARPQRSAKIPL